MTTATTTTYCLSFPLASRFVDTRAGSSLLHYLYPLVEKICAEFPGAEKNSGLLIGASFTHALLTLLRPLSHSRLEAPWRRLPNNADALLS